MLRKLIVLGVLGVLPALAYAQPQAGDWELTLTGNGASNKEFNGGNIGASAGLGYFLTQNLEIALRQSYTYVDADHDLNGDETGAGSSWSASTGAAIDFHFDLDRWQPFIGASIGYAYGKNVNDFWFAGLEGGLKYYVHRNAFIYGSATYQFDLEEKFGDGQMVYALGIGLNW